MAVDRKEEARRIVAELGNLIVHDMKGWHVPSRSRFGKEHLVSHELDFCTCEDHKYKGATCAHILAVEIVIQMRQEWEAAKQKYDSLRGVHSRREANALADRLGV